MPNIRGKFGCNEDHLWACTFGLNENGGMDDIEFEKYIMNSIVPLFPHAAECCGKRVLIKIDSSPGRLNLTLLSSLRILGFVLYPGVPNTTLFTQETDQNYGLFKSIFRHNLDCITQLQADKNEAVSLLPLIVGLFFWGGIDPETNNNIEGSAFASAFSRERCLAAWAKVGAAPCA